MNTQTQVTTRFLSVEAPARLHLGFMDLNGDLGRHFGSLGLAVNGLSVRVSARESEGLIINGQFADRAHRHVEALSAHVGKMLAAQLDIESAVPQHVGLGSGTLLALAVGSVIAKLHGIELEPRELAPILGRGKRSGIGIGAFEQGGFLTDGGHGAGSEVPRITARHAFPEDWPLLLIFDKRGQGLHGQNELRAFDELPSFPSTSAAELCRLVMMRILPALVHRDWESFGKGVGQVQRVVGDHYASAQGGRFASPSVAEALSWIESKGVHGVGQSSWGPTGFAILPNAAFAREIKNELEQRFTDVPNLTFMITTARNRGAVVEETATGSTLAHKRTSIG